MYIKERKRAIKTLYTNVYEETRTPKKKNAHQETRSKERQMQIEKAEVAELKNALHADGPGSSHGRPVPQPLPPPQPGAKKVVEQHCNADLEAHPHLSIEYVQSDDDIDNWRRKTKLDR